MTHKVIFTMQKIFSRRISGGFTIVELLVVIVVLGILASLVINGYAQAQHQAKVTKAKSDITTIKRAMLAYRIDTGELPPEGDWWNYDTVPPTDDGWVPVLESMVEGGYLASGTVNDLTHDPWGHAYGYDDNDCNSFAAPNDGTYIQSFGSNGVDDEPGDSGNDDISIRITDGCPY